MRILKLVVVFLATVVLFRLIALLVLIDFNVWDWDRETMQRWPLDMNVAVWLFSWIAGVVAALIANEYIPKKCIPKKEVGDD